METPKQQIDRLAKFIMEELPGEPSEGEGAVDTAIRWMRPRITMLVNETGFVLCPTCKEYVSWDDKRGAWCDRCNHKVKVRKINEEQTS